MVKNAWVRSSWPKHVRTSIIPKGNIHCFVQRGNRLYPSLPTTIPWIAARYIVLIKEEFTDQCGNFRRVVQEACCPAKTGEEGDKEQDVPSRSTAHDGRLPGNSLELALASS